MKDVLRRFAVLGSTSLLTQLIAFATLAITARRVGPANLGAYNVILAIITFLSLPISFGITNLGLRDVAQHPDRVREITGEIFVLQLILAVGSYVLLFALAPLIAPTDAAQQLLPIVALYLFTGTSFEWTLQALGRMRMVAVARLSGQVVFGVLVPFLVVSGSEGIERYAWLMVAGFAIKHVLTTVFLIRTVGVPRFRVTLAALWGRFRASTSMNLASVMAQAYGTMDLIMLGYLSTAADAGLYSAAYRLPSAILTFSGAWSGVVFPHSAALAAGDRGKLRGHASLMLSLTALFALPLAACTPFVAHGMMVAMFGAKFGPAGSTFALCTLGLALALVDVTLVSLVLALGGDRVYARAMMITAIFNVALNVPVILAFGRNGAAIVGDLSEAMLMLILLSVVRSQLRGLRLEWARIARAAAAVVPAVLALLVVAPSDASVWIRISLGATVYLVGTVLFGAVSSDEIRRLLSPRLAKTTERLSRA
jgi:O-antigen/teichoic acid export membrane protein